jgi:formate hydrogenlyase subunit 6/NADH:ubiquinone oxidoreductase subunit I
MTRVGKMFAETMRHVLKRPATVKYPYVRVEMPAKFRGKIKFDPDKCIGCKACMRDCPANAIRIIKVGEKRFEAEFRNDRCIFCAQCVDACPKDALEYTAEFELAVFDRKNLVTRFCAPPPKQPATEPGVPSTGTPDPKTP